MQQVLHIMQQVLHIMQQVLHIVQQVLHIVPWVMHILPWVMHIVPWVMHIVPWVMHIVPRVLVTHQWRLAILPRQMALLQQVWLHIQGAAGPPRRCAPVPLGKGDSRRRRAAREQSDVEPSHSKALHNRSRYAIRLTGVDTRRVWEL